MSKLLIIGADGFIGRHFTSLIKEKKDDFEIIKFDRNVFETDWQKYMNDIHPDYLVNLAWRTGAGYLDSNENIQFVRAGIEIYNAFYENGGKRAVYIGTEQEYEHSPEPLKETDKTDPVSLYAECKASLGKMLVKDSIINGRGFIWCRLFFVYGEGEKKERLMPYVIQNMVLNNDITCAYKEYIRDYIYVRDVATAIFTCLLADYTGYVNIGGGEKTCIGDIVETIRNITGSLSVVKYRTDEECRQNPCSCADISLLKSLGWEKKYSLYDGLKNEMIFLKEEMI